MSFKDLKLIKPLLKAVEASGYASPTLVQQKGIPAILERKDVIISAQTGTGKTATYALPILQQLFDRQDAPKRGKKIRALIIEENELSNLIKEIRLRVLNYILMSLNCLMYI